MRAGLIKADWEMSFTTSFQHTARVKYNVDFSGSSIAHIREKLNQLVEHMQNGEQKNIHVGYDFTLQDVEHLQYLLNAIEAKYKELFPVKALPNRKIYVLFQQLVEAEKQTPTQIAKEVLNEILTPPQLPKRTPKQQLKADAENLSKQRGLEYLRKKSNKKAR